MGSMDKQRRHSKHFQSMSSPNISDSTHSRTGKSQSAWSNQPANHPTSFVQSERRTVFSGDITKWTWTESHESCVNDIRCLPIMSEGCVIRKRLSTGVFQVIYSWQPWLMPPHTHTHSLKQTRNTVHLSWNPISLESHSVISFIASHPALKKRKITVKAHWRLTSYLHSTMYLLAENALSIGDL